MADKVVTWKAEDGTTGFETEQEAEFHDYLMTELATAVDSFLKDIDPNLSKRGRTAWLNRIREWERWKKTTTF